MKKSQFAMLVGILWFIMADFAEMNEHLNVAIIDALIGVVWFIYYVVAEWRDE